MEKIYTPMKMSKLDLDCMFFEIILSKKGDGFRARTSSLSQISNVHNARPEATSQYSYENAVQKLIPKIEKSLYGTSKKLGNIFQDSDGKLMFSIENIIYQNKELSINTNHSLSIISSVIAVAFENIINTQLTNNINITQIENSLKNIIPSSNAPVPLDSSPSQKVIKFQDVIIEWQKGLLERTKKDYEDDDYFSPTTLESYGRNLRNYILPYLKKHPEYDDINIFSEKNVDDIFSSIKCDDTKRVLLISLKLIFEFAKKKEYILVNPLSNKKFIASKRKKRKTNASNDYDFIEEEQRAFWINCMLKEINSEQFKHTDAPLAFLFMLLHGPRPEETCGVRWVDINFSENDYYVQNAFKKIPIYDNNSMQRIGWNKNDGPLKTPESYRHISLDKLIKPLLMNHKKNQKAEFKKLGKKWSEDNYIFLNSDKTPFTPDVLSKNFSKFTVRNKLNHIVLYGLRHSFATHCRNLGMKSEILALLMGHTEYETTQKYYIHFSSKQRKDELRKVQQKDIQNYLGKENQSLTHLQNNIVPCAKDDLNLQGIQKEDIQSYLQLNNDALVVLKDFISKINNTDKIVA